MSVLAIVEQRMAGEVLAAAQEFGSPLIAYSIDQPYTADAYTAAAEELIRKVNPTLVVFGHTYQTRDYVPKLAARFGRVLISDVIAAKPPVFVRQLFQGKFNADVRLIGDGPHFVSIQAGAWRAEGSPQVEIFSPSSTTSRQVAEPPFRETARAVDLSAADIIVSVGRGIRKRKTSRSLRRWLRLWVLSSPHRGLSAMPAGCPWSARWEARAKPSRPKSISPSGFRAPSST